MAHTGISLSDIERKEAELE